MMIRPTKIVRVAEGESPDAWRNALADPAWLASSTVLKQQPGSWVRRATIMGRDVVVKCRELSTLARRFKAAIGMGHAAKHWRGASLLRRAGVRTGEPFAIIRADIDGVPCELLVLEYVPGKSLLHVLDEIARGVGLPVPAQHALAREAGLSVSRVIAKGCFNRDHKPSNLIVSWNERSEPAIAVIDCVGVTGKWDEPNEAWWAAMLAGLFIEPLGTGCAPRRALWFRTFTAASSALSPSLLNSARGLRRIRLGWVTHRIRAHGDPRPEVDPLKPPAVHA